MIAVLSICLILAVLWFLLLRDFQKGLAFGVFVCVAMPVYLRLETPGDLPEFTIQRLVLISVFLVWLRTEHLKISKLPLLKPLLWWIIACLFSLLFTQAPFVPSLKRFLDFTIETFLFYLVIASSLRTRDDGLRIVSAAVIGLVLVAILAVIEKQTGFNPVDAYLPAYGRAPGERNSILSTYQHRILLGTAMAMGITLVLGMQSLTRPRSRNRLLLWGSLALLASACYFAHSRGPWFACAGGCLVLLIMGTSQLRLRTSFLAAAAAMTLLLNPGVFTTVAGLSGDTFNPASHKGGTFLYRLELWRIAAAEISKSPSRFLFGYGPGVGREMDLEWELSYRSRTQKIESWDNHYAYDLFQSGVLGFAASLCVSVAAGLLVFRNYRFCFEPGRDLLVGLAISVLILLFMKSNVLIFAKQLDYLFWALLAASSVISQRCSEENSMCQTEQALASGAGTANVVTVAAARAV